MFAEGGEEAQVGAVLPVLGLLLGLRQEGLVRGPKKKLIKKEIELGAGRGGSFVGLMKGRVVTRTGDSNVRCSQKAHPPWLFGSLRIQGGAR